MRVIFLLLCISLASGAVICKNHTSSCGQHTEYFTLFEQGLLNETDLFFPHMLTKDCTPLLNETEFLEKILSSCNCTLNISFVAIAEEIIDTSNSVRLYSRCEKGIYGNLIFTNKGWSDQMRGKSWSIVREEKKTIYGTRRYLDALDALQKCSGGCVRIDNQEYEPIVVISVMGTFLILLILFFIILFIIKKTGFHKTDLYYEIFV